MAARPVRARNDIGAPCLAQLMDTLKPLYGHTRMSTEVYSSCRISAGRASCTEPTNDRNTRVWTNRKAKTGVAVPIDDASPHGAGRKVMESRSRISLPYTRGKVCHHVAPCYRSSNEGESGAMPKSSLHHVSRRHVTETLVPLPIGAACVGSMRRVRISSVVSGRAAKSSPTDPKFKTADPHVCRTRFQWVGQSVHE